VDILIPKGSDAVTQNLIKEWRPFPKQELFLSIPDTIKEAFYGGGAGSAKTETLMMLPIVRGWHENPRFKQLFLRRTNPELKTEIIPRMKQIYPRFGATWNGQDLTWTFPSPDQYGAGLRGNSGAVITCGHCETEDDVHRYDGMEINLFTPDELTSLTQWIFLYIGYTRTRAAVGSGLPEVIRAGGMPGDIGHSWVKKRLIDPAPKGNVILVGRGGNKRIYIHATYLDNPHLGEAYGRTLAGLPEAERKAKLGDWEAYQGQVFDEFRDRIYHDEPDNALHVIEPFPIPDYWPKMIVGDWGFRAMTYVGFFAISPSGRLYLYRELHWTNEKIALWAPIVKDFADRENPRIIKFCKSVSQDRGLEHTVQSQLEEALGRYVELSENVRGSRVAGKILIHEYLRWKQRPIIPKEDIPKFDEGYAQWLYRNKSEQDYRNYLRLYDSPLEEGNLPKLQIFKTCTLMPIAIQSCVYEKAGKDGKPPEDVAEFPGDDPYDTLRYACDSAERYFEESKQEFSRIQEQERLVQTLQNTQDWTAFYRNMNRVESGQKMQSVSLFHKGRRRLR
jgi:hypothetical protein